MPRTLLLLLRVWGPHASRAPSRLLPRGWRLQEFLSSRGLQLDQPTSVIRQAQVTAIADCNSEPRGRAKPAGRRVVVMCWGRAAKPGSVWGVGGEEEVQGQPWGGERGGQERPLLCGTAAAW